MPNDAEQKRFTIDSLHNYGIGFLDVPIEVEGIPYDVQMRMQGLTVEVEREYREMNSSRPDVVSAHGVVVSLQNLALASLSRGDERTAVFLSTKRSELATTGLSSDVTIDIRAGKLV